MIAAALLIVHALLAVGLLGALTHQALAVLRAPAAQGAGGPPAQGFMRRYRAVDAAAYSNAIAVLFLCVLFMGAVLYPAYRLNVRPVLEIYNLRAANGAFEVKEHFAALGALLLPAYWAVWRQPLVPRYHAARLALTWYLAAIVWWNFITGLVLNNIEGLN